MFAGSTYICFCNRSNGVEELLEEDVSEPQPELEPEHPSEEVVPETTAEEKVPEELEDTVAPVPLEPVPVPQEPQKVCPSLWTHTNTCT